MNELPAGSLVAQEVLELFAQHGDSQYGGEAVSQQEHAIQAAQFAVQQHASSELIVAALLHDVGHLLHHLPADAPDHGIDDLHEMLGAEWLETRFGPAVVEPVRMHVAAKRYLCSIEPSYWERLSQPSQASLMLQGGVMSASECQAFERSPFAQAAVALRRFDDAAKVVGGCATTIADYLCHIEQAAAYNVLNSSTDLSMERPTDLSADRSIDHSANEVKR